MFAQRYVSAEEVLLLCPVAAEYPVAVMPNAKSFFPETHPRFIGTYWAKSQHHSQSRSSRWAEALPAGPSGSALHMAGTCIIGSRAAVTATANSNASLHAWYPDTAASLLCRPQMHTCLLEQCRMTTAQWGYSLLLKQEKMVNVSLMAACRFCWPPPLRHISARQPGSLGSVCSAALAMLHWVTCRSLRSMGVPRLLVPCLQVQDFRVTVAGKATFGCVLMSDFLHELAKELKANSQAFDNYQRM